MHKDEFASSLFQKANSPYSRVASTTFRGVAPCRLSGTAGTLQGGVQVGWDGDGMSGKWRRDEEGGNGTMGQWAGSRLLAPEMYCRNPMCGQYILFKPAVADVKHMRGHAVQFLHYLSHFWRP